MKKIKVGILGCASIAKKSVIPAILKNKDLELIAVASRTEEKANQFAELFNCEAVVGYQNLIERSDIDLLYIPLPTGLHDEWIIKALNFGKHVLAEKSLAENYNSAIKMVALAREKKLLLMESFMFLYHGQHQLIKELIGKGEIGEIRCFRSSFGFPPLDPENFRYNKDLGGGALLDAGAYTIRASQLFLGSDLWVSSATLALNNEKVDLFGGVYLKSENGTFAELAFGFDNFYQCNYEIWGSKGKITAQKAFTPGPDMEPVILLEKQGEVEEVKAKAENHFSKLMVELVNCLDSLNYEAKYEEILNQARLIDDVRTKSNEE